MKKLIITESQLRYITDKLLSEAGQIPEVKVVYRFKAAYEVGQSDPASFVTDFAKGLIGKINEAPNGKEMLSSGTMTLYSGTFTAGASNVWLGKPTAFDTSNNYLPKAPVNPDELYQKNVNLSLKRGQQFRTILFNTLKGQRINDSEAAKVTFKSMVLDTGGVKDEQRDASKYPNPGQFIQVNLVFRYAKDIQTPGVTTSEVITNTKEITKLTDIKKYMILTGSYYCNGKNSEGTPSGQPEMVKAMNENCAGVGGVKPENSKYSMAFEIKWNTNVMKDPYTVPILRWMFHFNQQGKIDKITRYVYNKEYIFLRQHVPQSTVSLDDKEMKYYMGIKAGQPDTGGPFYEKFIKPYI
jgi:hypothetical protein